jgi:hypothetical protein
MDSRSGKERRLALVAATVGLLVATLAPSARSAVQVSFEQIRGFDAPGTPDRYNRVGVLRTGPSSARNILVLNPGTSASAAYFVPLAKTIVSKAKGWQVWAVERRENLLEDHSMLDQAKEGRATSRQLSTTTSAGSRIQHHEPLPAHSGLRGWFRSTVGDARRGRGSAAGGPGRKRAGPQVVVGGHSLGGSITTAYATWDFNGKPGAKGLSGLVFIDGGSSPTPVTPEEAMQSLQRLQSSSPWLSFGGITAPFAGLFSSGGSTLTITDPNGPSIAQAWPLLPANLKAPVPATNEAQYGYALDTETSPPALVAAQAHLGHLATSGSPRGWVGAGELTPIQRYAEMFSGAGLKGLDGTAWYHPQRLTIDSGAVAAGNANPAQSVLDVRATRGDDLKGLRIYAFGAALGGQRVLDAATTLARQSHIPKRQLTLVNRQATYAHNDPNSASPENDFVEHLVPFRRSARNSAQ